MLSVDYVVKQEHSLNWNCRMHQRHVAAVCKVQLTMQHKLCLFTLLG